MSAQSIVSFHDSNRRSGSSPPPTTNGKKIRRFSSRLISAHLQHARKARISETRSMSSDLVTKLLARALPPLVTDLVTPAVTHAESVRDQARQNPQLRQEQATRGRLSNGIENAMPFIVGRSYSRGLLTSSTTSAQTCSVPTVLNYVESFWLLHRQRRIAPRVKSCSLFGRIGHDRPGTARKNCVRLFE